MRYLGKAASSAVLPPGGEVPKLDIKQFDQLGHGPHCRRHITGMQRPFGVLCQLPENNRCRLARTELEAKQGDGGMT